MRSERKRPAESPSPSPSPLLFSPRRAALWVVWSLYVYHLLLSDGPPGASILHPDAAVLAEAARLSLNFWYLMPLALPKLAPVLHPVLEAIFNLVVAWASLMFGFLSDDRGCPRQRVPMLPFCVGTALLTNVFFLPYLALRRGKPRLYAAAAATAARNRGASVAGDSGARMDWLWRVSESKALPAVLTVVWLASIAWAAAGRPAYFASTASTATTTAATTMTTTTTMTTSLSSLASLRWSTFAHLVRTDRLAYSFVLDALTFYAFQAALVPDDMRRRGLDPEREPRARRLLRVARALPFLGVAWYLYVRGPLMQPVPPPPPQQDEDSDDGDEEEE